MSRVACALGFAACLTVRSYWRGSHCRGDWGWRTAHGASATDVVVRGIQLNAVVCGKRRGSERRMQT